LTAEAKREKNYAHLPVFTVCYGVALCNVRAPQFSFVPTIQLCTRYAIAVQRKRIPKLCTTTHCSKDMTIMQTPPHERLKHLQQTLLRALVACLLIVNIVRLGFDLLKSQFWLETTMLSIKSVSNDDNAKQHKFKQYS